LKVSDLEALNASDVLAIRVSKFYPDELCDKISKLVIGNPDLDSYAVEPTLQRFAGKALFDAANDPSMLENYYTTAPKSIRAVRDAIYPYLAPIDQVRLILQEVWPAGSMLENFHGRLVNSGLVRVFGTGSKALAHQDSTHWDIPTSHVAWSLISQFAVNVHLRRADAGGELVLWDFGFTNKSDHDAAQVDGKYAINESLIPVPKLVVVPEKGDLILFNARRVHAVRPILAGTRVAASTFIGYRGPASPLTLFS